MKHTNKQRASLRPGRLAAVAAASVFGLTVQSVFAAADQAAAPAAAAKQSGELRGTQLAGVWQPLGPPVRLSSNPVFTPETKAAVDEQTRLRAAGDISGDSSALCIPPTMHTMTTIGVQEILIDRKKITWIMESSNGIRWIWLDGRAHPPADELRPTAFGHSIGRWEGDVLVVDTVGFMPSSKYYVNRPGNEALSPGPQAHVVERIQLADGGQTLVNERTFTDPGHLAEPWKTTVRYQRHDDWEIGEIICAENNRPEDYSGIADEKAK